MSDAGRKIAYIKYDYNNNPVRIQFTNGCVTNYIYSATGEKLRVIYQTAVPNIEVAIGETRELTTNELVNKKEETVDYLLGGALTLKNGRIDKYQFEEGYCQAKRYNNTMDDFTFCYYDKDHLGDIRQVTEADGSKKGTIIQKMNYYPFGAEFCDASADSLVQPYKYNGKELDRMHGLNTYDYGARQHDPILGRWDRIDPLCETDYKTSPYSYCNNSPINAVDPDGNLTVFINGWKPLPSIQSNKGYWVCGSRDYAMEFDSYFKQDHEKAVYHDGSGGGTVFSSQKRYENGYEQGKIDAHDILYNLDRKNGTIVEPLILLTHSMGGAYGKGYAQAIMDYYNRNKDRYKGFKIYEYDIAPYQANEQRSVKGVRTIQIHDKGDGVATLEPIKGADNYYVVDSGLSSFSSHQLDNQAFWNQVRNLSEGFYRVENGQIIRQ